MQAGATMALIDWDDRLMTGHAAMDREHKKITGLINELAESLAAGKSKSHCGEILTELVQRTEAHFAMEAKLMDRHRYPYAENHIVRHERLMNDLMTFQAWFASGVNPQFGSVLAFLEGWWTRHITSADKELADYIAAIPRPARRAVQPPA